jgi:hypothetical protein
MPRAVQQTIKSIESFVIVFSEREVELCVFCIIYALDFFHHVYDGHLVCDLRMARVLIHICDLPYMRHEIRAIPHASRVSPIPHENTGLHCRVGVDCRVAGSLIGCEPNLCAKREHLGLVEVVTEPLTIWRHTDAIATFCPKQ